MRRALLHMVVHGLLPPPNYSMMPPLAVKTELYARFLSGATQSLLEQILQNRTADTIFCNSTTRCHCDNIFKQALWIQQCGLKVNVTSIKFKKHFCELLCFFTEQPQKYCGSFSPSFCFDFKQNGKEVG